MARLSIDFFAESLGLSTTVTVLLPEAAAGQIGMAGVGGDEPPGVLYLLHGLSDDHTTWTRRTALERHVAAFDLAVVMPQVGRSFYCDEVHGNRYWTFLSEELPAVVQRFLRVGDDPARTYVAGLSMGGYGALKWALRQPERFAAAASLSGVLDLGALVDDERWRPALTGTIWGGTPVAGTPDDPLWLLARADPERTPALFVSCGTEDELIEGNRRFVARARARGLPVAGGFVPGEHEWGLWDRTIADVLAWLPGLGGAQ